MPLLNSLLILVDILKWLLFVLNAGKVAHDQSYSAFIQLSSRGKMPDGKTYLCTY